MCRNSKLTHVLADCLQRDSKALMIVQVLLVAAALGRTLTRLTLF